MNFTNNNSNKINYTNMFIPILSFSNICDIARNCYPEIVNGYYCLSDPKLLGVTFYIQDDSNNEAHKTIMCGGEGKIEEQHRK